MWAHPHLGTGGSGPMFDQKGLPPSDQQSSSSQYFPTPSTSPQMPAEITPFT
eukprot:gene12889-20824_t